jgi:hypothetical protein
LIFFGQSDGERNVASIVFSPKQEGIYHGILRVVCTTLNVTAFQSHHHSNNNNNNNHGHGQHSHHGHGSTHTHSHSPGDRISGSWERKFVLETAYAAHVIHGEQFN